MSQRDEPRRRERASVQVECGTTNEVISRSGGVGSIAWLGLTAASLIQFFGTQVRS